VWTSTWCSRALTWAGVERLCPDHHGAMLSGRATNKWRCCPPARSPVGHVSQLARLSWFVMVGLIIYTSGSTYYFSHTACNALSQGERAKAMLLAALSSCMACGGAQHRLVLCELDNHSRAVAWGWLVRIIGHSYSRPMSASPARELRVLHAHTPATLLYSVFSQRDGVAWARAVHPARKIGRRLHHVGVHTQQSVPSAALAGGAGRLSAAAACPRPGPAL